MVSAHSKYFLTVWLWRSGFLTSVDILSTNYDALSLFRGIWNAICQHNRKGNHCLSFFFSLFLISKKRWPIIFFEDFVDIVANHVFHVFTLRPHLCYFIIIRGGSRTAATSKMERFLIIVKGWKSLTIITERSILDVAAVQDPPPIITE